MIDVRPAVVADCEAWASVRTAATPYLVATAEGAAFELQRDSADVTRTVATVADRTVGTGRLGLRGKGSATLSLAVHPDHLGRGVGSALLADGIDRAGDLGVDRVEAIVQGDDRSLAVARHWGFELVREHRVSAVDPRAAENPPPTPDGYSVHALSEADLEQVWEVHQAAAPGDPSGLSRRMSLDEFRDEYAHPCLRTDLSRAVMVGDSCAAFSTLVVAGERGWSAMSGTHPEHRGRGLAVLVKAHVLRAAADAGVSRCATANDSANAAMLRVNSRLGYRPYASTWSARLDLS